MSRPTASAFDPHDFDRSLWATDVDVALADIECATTEPSGGPGLLVTRPQELLSGGALRTRLRVGTVDGKTELFVVSDPEPVARATEDARESQA